MIVKLAPVSLMLITGFESSVNSYDSQTIVLNVNFALKFESSVNSYDSQTKDVYYKG